MISSLPFCMAVHGTEQEFYTHLHSLTCPETHHYHSADCDF